MSYLTDGEHRILLAALRREKEFCSRQLTSSKECVKIVQSLERKFYYDRFEQEIRDKAIDEFAKKMKEVSYQWFKHGVMAIGMIDEITEQMKEVGE